jgi:uncharacterized protein (TIGR03546 family)
MFTLKLLGRILNAINAGAAPWQVGGGMVLGFALGLIPGWPLQAFGLLLIILLINVNTSIAVAGAVIASLLAWLLDPIMDRIGAWMLQDIGALKGLWTVMYNSPPLALTRFNNTVVMGSMVVGVIGAVIWFPILIWAVRVYRAKFLAWVQKLWIMRLITGSKVWALYQRISNLGLQ